MDSALANMQLFLTAPLGHCNAAHGIMGQLARKKNLKLSGVFVEQLFARHFPNEQRTNNLEWGFGTRELGTGSHTRWKLLGSLRWVQSVQP